MVANNNNNDSGIYLQKGNTPLKSIDAKSYGNFRDAMITELMKISSDSKSVSLSDLLKKSSDGIIKLVEGEGQFTFEKDNNENNFPSTVKEGNVHPKSPFAQLVNVIAKFEKNPKILNSPIIKISSKHSEEQKKKCEARNKFVQNIVDTKNNSALAKSKSDFVKINHKTIILKSDSTKHEFNQFLDAGEKAYQEKTPKEKSQMKSSALKELMNIDRTSERMKQKVFQM